MLKRWTLVLMWSVMLPVGVAGAQQWVKPTPEELSLKSIPEAPEAKAVVLYRMN